MTRPKLSDVAYHLTTEELILLTRESIGDQPIVPGDLVHLSVRLTLIEFQADDYLDLVAELRLKGKL